MRSDIIRLPDRKDFSVGEMEYADCKGMYRTWADKLDEYKGPKTWCDGEPEVRVGGGGKDGCIELLGFGDPGAFKRSREMMRDIERIDFSNLERQYLARPRGSSPIVPAYLHGNPASMHCMDEEEGTGPIRLWYNIDAAHYYSSEQLMRRGLAVAALGLALSRVRPVELFAWFANNPGHRHKEGLVIIRMGLSPFDSGRIGAMCNSAFFRRMGFVAIRRVWGWEDTSRTTYIASPNHPATYYIEAGPDDIVIPRAQNRQGDPILRSSGRRANC